MAGGYCVGQYGIDGILTINAGGVGGTAVALNGPAWDVPLLAKMWVEHAVRGDNQTLPGAPGRRSYPRRVDQKDHTLHLTVLGWVNVAGTAYTAADVNSGMAMYTNLQYLWTNVFSPVTTGRGIRPASLLLPDGTTTLTADVQLTPLVTVGEDFNVFEQDFTFTLTIPAGRFV